MRQPIIFAVAMAAMAASASAQTIRIPQDCREMIPTDVTVQLKPEGRSDAAIRSALRAAATLEAVQQTTGTQVRSQAVIDLESVHGTETTTKTKSRFAQRMASQAAGLVALKVTDEKVSADQASLSAKAEVCVPRDPGALKETVSIGGFLSSQGDILQDGVSALKDTFSTSRSFSVIDDVENVDWVIDGRIDNVDVRQVTGTQSAREIAQGVPAKDFQRIQVSGHLDARNTDGRHFTIKFDENRNIFVTRDPLDVMNEWIPQLLSTASHQLEGRLVTDRAGVPDKPKSSEPKW